MPRMLDQIRSSALSANLVQAAARGALLLPPEETVEILVYLANNNKVYGDLARMTLAGWDEKSSIAVASNPKAPAEVLQYLASPQNLRPKLLPALLENPSVSEKSLAQLALTGSRDVVEAMLKSPRVKNSSALRASLADNPRLKEIEAASLQAAAQSAPEASTHSQDSTAEVAPGDVASGSATEDVEVAAFLKEHAAEIAAEEGKPFQPIGGILDELGEADQSGAGNVAAEQPTPQTTATTETTGTAEATATSNSVSPEAAAVQTAPSPRPTPPKPVQVRRGSALQKIASLDVKGRIQLAMKGNKEERSILIRDGTKIVALAVLDSPKITDGEVEKFANQKNVLEAVLRGILMKRRFAKNYTVIRNLVANPRTPIDVALGLMKNLLVGDLKNLSNNKEVSETVRKLALRMFKQKSETNKKNE
jgi:hypothetical protein